MFTSAYYDPALENVGLTMSKRPLADAIEDLESVQLSSTNLTKDVQKEK